PAPPPPARPARRAFSRFRGWRRRGFPRPAFLWRSIFSCATLLIKREKPDGQNAGSGGVWVGGGAVFSCCRAAKARLFSIMPQSQPCAGTLRQGMQGLSGRRRGLKGQGRKDQGFFPVGFRVFSRRNPRSAR